MAKQSKLQRPHDKSYHRPSKLPAPLGEVSPQYHDRFAAFGDADEIRVYRWLENGEVEVRRSTRIAFSRPIELWQRSLRLRINHMLPGTPIDLPDQTPRDTEFWQRRFSLEYRHHLLALSISTSKSIADLIMGGHYTEAFALQRTAIERWKSSLYARVRQDDVLRFMPPEWLDQHPELEDLSREDKGKVSGEDWKIMASRIKGRPDEALLSLANVLARQLHQHVHPTWEGVSQIFIDMDRFNPAASPQFSELHAQLGLRNLLFLEELNLFETIALGKSTHVPRRKILKFANGEMFRQLQRFFEMDMHRNDADEPIEPVLLEVPDDTDR